MVGVPGKSFSVAELEAAGVKRISLATSLYRAAMSGLIAAAQEIRQQRTFGYVERATDSYPFRSWPTDDLNGSQVATSAS